MTRRHCPTCQQVLPDKNHPAPLPVRVRQLLVDAAEGLTPKQIRQALAVSETTLYQTLRRMRDRGDVERRSVPSPGGGEYMNLYFLGGDSQADESVVDPRVHEWARDLMGYREGVPSLTREKAHAWVMGLGADSGQADSIVAAVMGD